MLGLNAAMVDRLRPFVTLYSGQSSIDPDTAPPGLLEALSSGYAPSALTGARSPGMSNTAGGLLPADFVSPSIRRHFTVHSAALTDTGAIYVREAVVELGRARSQSFSFRRWQRGLRRELSTPPANALPPC